MPINEHHGSEQERSVPWIHRNHDKNPGSPIDKIVPLMMGRVLSREYTEVEAIAYGGSYAKGKHRFGDDVDIDVLYRRFPAEQIVVAHILSLRDVFTHYGFALNVRACLERTGQGMTLRPDLHIYRDRMILPELGLYTRHPHSPYSARTQEALLFWKLEGETRYPISP